MRAEKSGVTPYLQEPRPTVLQRRLSSLVESELSPKGLTFGVVTSRDESSGDY